VDEGGAGWRGWPRTGLDWEGRGGGWGGAAFFSHALWLAEGRADSREADSRESGKSTNMFLSPLRTF
jgi:hypothetical protein